MGEETGEGTGDDLHVSGRQSDATGSSFCDHSEGHLGHSARKFQSESFVTELCLQQRVYWAMLPEGADVSVHIDSQDIAVLLAGVGARVTNRELILAPLGSLPDGYSGLAMALELQRLSTKDIHLVWTVSVRILWR